MLSPFLTILSLVSVNGISFDRVVLDQDVVDAFRDVDSGTGAGVGYYSRTLFREGDNLLYVNNHDDIKIYDTVTSTVTSVPHTLMSHGTSIIKTGSTYYMCGRDSTSGNFELRPFTWSSTYASADIVPGTTVTIDANTNSQHVAMCSVDAAGTQIAYYSTGGKFWIYRIAEGTLHSISGGTITNNGGDVLIHPYGDRIFSGQPASDNVKSYSLTYDSTSGAYATVSELGSEAFSIAPRGMDVSDNGHYVTTMRQGTSLVFIMDAFTVDILQRVDACPGVGCVDSSITESNCISSNTFGKSWNPTLGGCKLHNNYVSKSTCDTAGGTISWVDTGSDRGPCSTTYAGFEATSFNTDFTDDGLFYILNSGTLWKVYNFGGFTAVTNAPPAPPPAASSLQDPHIVYPNGARTDVRGFDGAFLNYISYPGLTVNVKTENATFQLGNTTVRGSFITELHVSTVANDDKKKVFQLSHFAKHANSNQWGWDMVKSSCGGHTYNILPHSTRKCEEVDAQVDLATSLFRGHDWEVSTTVMPVYGHINGCNHRLDIRVHYGGAHAERAHGILGQGFAKGARQPNGRLDAYPEHETFTSTAQGEGAIEGTIKDYVVTDAFSSPNWFKHEALHDNVLSAQRPTPMVAYS